MGEHISGWVVMLLGMGIVFIGLVSLIFITKIMSALCRTGGKPKEATAAPEASVTAAAAIPAAAQADRGQFVAVVAAAVATAMDTEPNGLRIHSIRKI